MNSRYLSGRFSYKTDIGRIRMSNEDQAAAMINASGNVLLVVCDGMGTTITLLLIIKDTAILGHVGDSRCYFLRNRREFVQMSEDQTYVGYLLRTGQISQEEALTHPKRHVLMNALGVYPSASVDVKTFPYMGETVLLCSDGLYNNVPVNDIASVLKGEDTVEQKVDELIAIGNKNGGSDNIAVVIWEAQE